MDNAKPKNIDEYKKWLKKDIGIEITKRTESYYNSVVGRIKSEYEKTEFWKELLHRLQSFNDEYSLATGYQLILANFSPELVTKSFDSTLIKSYRKNVLYNHNWPKPPEFGWSVPDNWFENINDLLRTYFVVKYLDGVEFLLQKIQTLSAEFGFNFNPSFEAKEEGYYALHLYTKHNFEVPRMDWDTENKLVSVEFQITTQLQDVITKLTHQYYERRRIKIDKDNQKWQWNYKSEEFAPNYLGHILHYVEGMIMEIREKQRIKTHE